LAETVLWLVVCILASWRVSYMLAQEDGPADIFSRFQQWAAKRSSWIGRGLACALCTGVYVSLAITLIALPLLPITDWRSFVLIYGCVVGGQAIIQKVIG
jgi:hypothetical protein